MFGEFALTEWEMLRTQIILIPVTDMYVILFLSFMLRDLRLQKRIFIFSSVCFDRPRYLVAQWQLRIDKNSLI